MKKGFTLIELLAVIIVLGMVIALALPGVNKIIESSEKRTFIADANFIIESVRNKVKAGEYIGIEGSNEVLIVMLNRLDFSRGSTTSAFGNEWDYTRSYVLAHNVGSPSFPNYNYYVALLDTDGIGITLTKEDDLHTNKIQNSPTIVPVGKVSSSNVIKQNVDGYTNTFATNTFSILPSVNKAYAYGID